MTRKTCTNQPHVDTVLQSVCPELFCLDHGRPGHLKRVTRHRVTRSHLDYVDIENLYGASSAIKLFLKIDGINLNKNTRSVSMARNKMPRTRTSSVCYKLKQLPHHGHQLRARRHTTFTNSFVDTSGDDDSNHVKPMRELRSSSRLSLAQVKAAEQEQDTWDSGRPKRACIKQKRISADERLVVDNKNYYKVEVMRNKLRSSDVLHREPEIAVVKKIKSPHISEDSEDDKGLLGKFPFKKLRNSELTQLNNEAENFLFPRKDESSSEDDTDADGSNTSPVNSKKGDQSVVSSDSSSKLNKSSKTEPEEETSMDSTSSETSTSRKKRRLTQAEAFILDNQRYYKFETPGSRLRYQGSYLAPLPSKNNGEYSTNKHSRSKEHHHNHKEIVKPKLDLNELKFSFEMVPNMEAWYKTFQRQDNGEEHYSCYSCSNPGFYKPFLLPYEMGPLPPLDPRVCLFGYNQMKKRFLGDNGTTTSAACSTSDSCSGDIPVKGDDLSSTEDTKSSEDSTLVPEFTESLFRKSKPGPKPGPRRGFGAGKNPRKSPRQHASTLAILSSLLHQRKRRETHKDQNSSKHNLSAISEEGKEREPPEPEPDYDEIAKNISDLFTNCMEQMDEVGTSAQDGVDVNVHCKPDAIQALQDFVHYKEDYEGPTLPTAKLHIENSTPRKPYRKKKKNRTGWPNKNKRTVFRKEGSDSRDGLPSSEHNSAVNSPKVRAESEENEENIEDNNRNNKNRKNVSLSKLSSYIEVTNDKINGDVQVQPSNNKLNGVSENYEVNFRNITTPKRKEHRESSSDNCAEVVIASVGDKIDCVNVGLDEWENAERVLAAKLRSEANDIQFQPIVRVQKLDSDAVKRTEKRLRNSPSPRRTRPRRMPASPKSPRMLRRPRGGWYRERYNNN